VHALGQRAHILPSAPCPIPTEKLGAVLNTRLPDDIAVTAVGIVPDSFHPIADAISKTYSYKILNTPLRNPLISRYSVHETTPLLVAAMEEACQYFVGEHDFAAFCATGSPVSSTIRRVNSLELSVSGGLIDMQINGNGFLYNMVRIIAGTLVGVGMGKIRPDGICDIIASKKREKAGKTMPAHGLTLVNIFY
ncbi:MAG: tRNA pseudouridine synthase A, partial [Defluviitaleaceae bacterium]|nr:tRNA pseudouridine synthase A [Defluviitaleaceae bacterium]